MAPNSNVDLRECNKHRLALLPHRILEPASALGFRRARVGEKTDAEGNPSALYPFWAAWIPTGPGAAIFPPRRASSAKPRDARRPGTSAIGRDAAERVLGTTNTLNSHTINLHRLGARRGEVESAPLDRL